MTYKKNNKKRRKRNAEFFGFSAFDEKDMSREKEKARDLRNSGWWRKKCSNGVCSYCRVKISPCELTMDHVIPLSRGGRSERYNIVPACKDCNNKKKYYLPVEWEEYLEKIRCNDLGQGK